MEMPFKKELTRTLKNANVTPDRPTTKLIDAVPVTQSVDTTYITLHSHKIIIERQDGLYKTLAVLEGVLLITSSLLMISLSAASIIFAMSVVQGVF